MIAHKAFANARVHSALGTFISRFCAFFWTMAADRTLTLYFCMNGVVVSDHCDGSIASSACLHGLPIGSEQLHQGMHELFSEIEPRSMLADRPQLEGIHDAHVEQPPCKARPRLLALPSYQVGVGNPQLINTQYGQACCTEFCHVSPVRIMWALLMQPFHSACFMPPLPLFMSNIDNQEDALPAAAAAPYRDNESLHLAHCSLGTCAPAFLPVTGRSQQPQVNTVDRALLSVRVSNANTSTAWFYCTLRTDNKSQRPPACLASQSELAVEPDFNELNCMPARSRSLERRNRVDLTGQRSRGMAQE